MNKKEFFYKMGKYTVALIVTIGVVAVAKLFPSVIEYLYSQGAYPYIASLLSYFSNLFDRSLWDIFWVVFITWILFLLFRIIFKQISIKLAILRLYKVIVIGVIYFYVSWGLNYYREPLECKLFGDRMNITESALLSTIDRVVDVCNSTCDSYMQSDVNQLNNNIEDSYKNWATTLSISYPSGKRFPKSMRFPNLWAKSGITGYYGPFFSEVHINSYLLKHEVPFVLAHEKAHQLGFASEAEANFIGWLVCNGSSSDFLRYSSNLAILQYLISEVKDLKQRTMIISHLNPKVLADIKQERTHWRSLRDEKMDQVQTKAQDVYLKSNGIEKGVGEYNEVTHLVVSWFCRNEYMQNRNI